MQIAFAIFKIFPYGGIARDLNKIAARCLARGHTVRVYAMVWEGEPLAGAEAVLLPARGVRSHIRQRRFAAQVADHLHRHPVDLVVGMNKMPGLDVYYAGDSCFEDKARRQRPWPYRLTPRYRHFADFERAVFAEEARTRILTIAPGQDDVFNAIYGTPRHRFHALPPGLERDRLAGNDVDGAALREQLGVATHESLLLFVGSGFVKKGLDRALVAIAALPEAIRATVRLVVVGEDRTRRFERLANRLGLTERVCFVGGRDDVPALLGAADAFTLPAYDEAAGMVILEAAVTGLPVLITANCGYASLIAAAGAGIVTPVPFDQGRFNADLLRLLTSDEHADWTRNGGRMGRDDSLYAMAPCAVDLLEGFVHGREPPLVVFCAFRFSPTDPRCRDLLPVAVACRERGLNVRIYACIWQGDVPAGIDLVRVPVAAMMTSVRFDRYRRWVAAALQRLPAACMIGFEAMPGTALELGERPDPMVDELPPGMGTGPPPASQHRENLRAALGFEPDDVVFVMVGDDLVVQGVERLLAGLGRLPAELRSRTRVLALGHLAGGLGMAARILGLRERTRIVESGMFWRDAIEAGDVFVDLAYLRSSNGWVFDALAAGKAVLTHDWVAQARMVREADAGVVLPSPMRQADCNHALVELVTDAPQRGRWQANAARYGSAPAGYGRAACLAELIEQRCARLGRGNASAAVEAPAHATLSA